MMNYRNVESKLTPDAKKALEEVAKEYRQKILFQAEEIAHTQTGDAQEISASDVFLSIQRINRTDRSFTSLFRINSVLYILLIIFLVINLAVVYIKRDIVIPEYQFGQTIIVIGIPTFIFIIITSITVYALSRYNIRAGDIYGLASGDITLSSITRPYDPLIKWIEIEKEAKYLVASLLGDSSTVLPIARIISVLQKESILDIKDASLMRSLLITRNKIVHDGFILSRPEVDKYINDAERIIAKMKTASLKKK